MDAMNSAHKIGEVVGPAGGETDIPHCLAEVYKPPESDIKSLLKRTVLKLTV